MSTPALLSDDFTLLLSIKMGDAFEAFFQEKSTGQCYLTSIAKLFNGSYAVLPPSPFSTPKNIREDLLAFLRKEMIRLPNYSKIAQLWFHDDLTNFMAKNHIQPTTTHRADDYKSCGYVETNYYYSRAWEKYFPCDKHECWRLGTFTELNFFKQSKEIKNEKMSSTIIRVIDKLNIQNPKAYMINNGMVLIEWFEWDKGVQYRFNILQRPFTAEIEHYGMNCKTGETRVRLSKLDDLTETFNHLKNLVIIKTP